MPPSVPPPLPPPPPFTVVLLPGLACDAALFEAVLPALRADGHAVRVADVHMHAATLPAMARRLLDENSGPLVLAGASMGGMVALHAHRLAPDRVAALALLGTSARADTAEVRALREQACARFAAGRVDEVLRVSTPLALHPAHERRADLVAHADAMFRRAGALQLVAQNRAVMAREDLRAHLPAVACPTLVVCGEADRLTPPEHARELAAGIVGARLEWVAGAGHLPTLEQPARVTALLRHWLGTLR